VTPLRARPIPAAAYAVARWAVTRGRSAQETKAAEYCYRTWQDHLRHLAAAGLATQPRAIAELGPGASLGVGFCALIEGADRYVALDVRRYADRATNLAVFDDLVPLLAPADPRRLSLLRDLVAQDGIEYIVPWDDPGVIEPDAFDLIVSTAVLEHVGDVRATYAAIARWLAPKGVTCHQIDFRSHGRAIEWNGHWAYPDWIWRWIGRGRSPINRQPLSRHLEAIADAGLELIDVQPLPRDDGLRRQDLDRSWQWLSDEDLHTESAYLIAAKPGLS
jgi:SAM-dependent methyltransferase